MTDAYFFMKKLIDRTFFPRNSYDFCLNRYIPTFLTSVSQYCRKSTETDEKFAVEIVLESEM